MTTPLSDSLIYKRLQKRYEQFDLKYAPKINIFPYNASKKRAQSQLLFCCINFFYVISALSSGCH